MSVKRARRRGGLAVAIAAVVALFASMTLASASAGASPLAAVSTPGSPAIPASVPALGKDLRVTGGVTPSVGAATAASEYCSTCKPPLTYRGGPVMGTPTVPGRTVVESIYWAPRGTSYSSTFSSVINTFLKNVAAASGAKNNVFSVPVEYHGLDGKIHYSVGFGGTIADTAAFPAGGCPVTAPYTACVTDAQLQHEIARLINARHLPVDAAHLYSVFLPAHVNTCDAPGDCTSNAFCGYHSAFLHSGKHVLYSNEPYPDLVGCNSGQAPNGNPWADTAIKTESHEIIEAITDPFGTGWIDSAGNEIGDECSQFYGTVLGSTNPAHSAKTKYNQVIGNGKYYIQTMFSDKAFKANRLKGCRLGAV
jgi:hypothetical protein